MFSAAGSDILLLTPPSSNVSLIEYRQLGGTLDFYFFSGPSPQKVIEQYGELVGMPTWQPAWGFGFHLCRWGYVSVNDTMEQVQKMREANIPLEGTSIILRFELNLTFRCEVMWNDIDLYHAVRDFTNDPISFPIDEVKAFIDDLVQILLYRRNSMTHCILNRQLTINISFQSWTRLLLIKSTKQILYVISLNEFLWDSCRNPLHSVRSIYSWCRAVSLIYFVSPWLIR